MVSGLLQKATVSVAYILLIHVELERKEQEQIAGRTYNPG
jgi:hypothetical protein